MNETDIIIMTHSYKQAEFDVPNHSNITRNFCNRWLDNNKIIGWWDKTKLIPPGLRSTTESRYNNKSYDHRTLSLLISFRTDLVLYPDKQLFGLHHQLMSEAFCAAETGPAASVVHMLILPFSISEHRAKAHTLSILTQVIDQSPPAGWVTC